MYKGKKVIHIVARGYNGEIGANNKLLWSIPEDMKHFKESTIGNVVLMGRNTIESLPKPLTRRVVMEVSSKTLESYRLFEDEELKLEWLLDDALYQSNLLNTDCIFIAGGGQLYNSTFDIADELLVTQVEKSYHNADTFYHIPENFELIDEVYGDECNGLLSYSFQKWIKIK